MLITKLFENDYKLEYNNKYIHDINLLNKTVKEDPNIALTLIAPWNTRYILNYNYIITAVAVIGLILNLILLKRNKK